jgi:hypothetical protein
MPAEVRPPVDVGRVALCSSNPALFDSLDYGDHMSAREWCEVCFSRSSCRLYALGNPDATGTYGGDLFRAGVTVMAVR